MRQYIVALMFILILYLPINSHQATVVKSQDGYEPGQIELDPIGAEMVYVPGGEFEFGVSDQFLKIYCEQVFQITDSSCVLPLRSQRSILPPQNMIVEPFWIDRYEVTVEQSRNCNYPHINYCLEFTINELDPELNIIFQHPVLGVTWYEAEMYCNLRGARLPTAYEWEYAASGPDNLNFPWGQEFTEVHAIPAEVYPVGTMAHNISWIGIYDMSGNAGEWTLTTLTELGIDTSRNFPLREGTRIYLGGSWGYGTAFNTTFELNYWMPFSIDHTMGIRCARTTPPHLN